MKILFVEDHQAFCVDWIHNLRDLHLEVRCLSAYNLTQARELFVEHSDIEIIVVDGNLGAGENGLTFVKEIRAQFHGKIIAASGDSAICRQMVEAGADLSCRGSKYLIPTIIKEAL